MRQFFPILFLVGLFSGFTHAQSPRETGFPIVTNFAPKDYDGLQQNWAIVQDSSGLIYVANNQGLLEYDGVHWRKYPLPDQSIVRSLAIGEGNRIYVGANGDLGYFEPDGQGKLNFFSLKAKLPDDKQDFPLINGTFIFDGKVFFSAGKYEFIWDTKKQVFSILESESTFLRPFVIGNSLYQAQREKGLARLINGRFSPLSGGELFGSAGLYVMLPLKNEEGKILLATRLQGMFLYDGEEFIPFRSEVDDFLKENLITSGTILSDGNILLGTFSGGAVIINPKGELLNSYNQNNGLRDNSILFAYQDRSGELWLATGNGISHVAYTAPVQWFDSRSGLTSTVNDLIRHRGNLYAATQTGVFVLDPQIAQFRKLEGMNNQSWQFHAAGEELILATNQGLLKLDKDQLIPVRPNIDKKYLSNVIIPSLKHPERIFVGTTTGLWSLRKSGKEWIDEGRLVEILDQPTSLVENKDGSLWMGTISSGLYHIIFAKDNQGNLILENPVSERFDAAHGLQGGRVFPRNIKGTVFFITHDSLYVFQESSKRFVADTSLALIRDYHNFPATAGNAKNLYQDQQGILWLETIGGIAMCMTQPDESYHWISTPFNRIADASPYYTEENGIVWMVSDEGLIRFDLEKAKAAPADYRALIRQVTIAGDSVLYFGSMANQPSVPEIPYASNSLRFDFGAASFEDHAKLRFATLLQGFDKDWTPWNNEPFKEYTNLAPGMYTFQVKAIDLNGKESITASYTFEILPPWWRTWWAYALFILLFLAAGFAILRWRTKALQREKEVLEQKVLSRTAELKQSLENLKSTQAQLIQSEKMASLGELTAGIAHEIQNPLNFVNNFAEINNELLDELSGELQGGRINEADAIARDLRANNEKIVSHGKRADAIVKSMLQHSRSSSGQKEPTDLNALCDEYLRLAYHGLRAKDNTFNATLNTDFDTTMGRVSLIPQDMGRVLLNLINNAFYAVSEKSKTAGPGYEPTVGVTTRREATSIRISITDNGNGIPQQVIDKIFQPFFTTKPTGEGTGLGLSLSYDIVTKGHGGELKVKTMEGEGSEFMIQLPLA